jgi:putative DNA primase/helicase
LTPEVAARIAQMVDGPRPPPKCPDEPPPPKRPHGNVGDPPSGRPEIEIRAGELDRIVRESEAALAADPPILFSRGAVLVRPGEVPVEFCDGTKGTTTALYTQSTAAIYGCLSERIRWTRENRRKKARVPCDPSKEAAQIIVARCGQWRFPEISGTVACPTLRKDGSLLSGYGFDAASRIYCSWRGGDLGLQPNPTRAEAEDELDDLSYLIHEFPAVSDVDRSILLSGLITPVVRGAFGAAPLHGITAPSAGTGKSFFVDLSSMIATGRRCPVQSATANDEESEKRLGAAMLAGLPIINIDNVNGVLSSDLLCQAITQSSILMRPLGSSGLVEISNRCCFFATGNSLRVSGDLLRRSLLANLDAEMERPETRRFENDPVEMVTRDRARYVRAALAIVLGYIASGDYATLDPLLGFEEWSTTVRSALVWLGCADPAEAIKASRVADPELQALRSFIGFVRDKFASSAFSVADIISLLSSKGSGAGFEQHCESDDEREQRQARAQEEAKLSAEFRELLLSIAGSRGVVNGKRLSTWLRRNCRRIVGGYRIEERGKDSHTEGMMFAIVTL